MLRYARSGVLIVLVAAASLATGYVLPRPQPPHKSGDVLDAVAAVQRRLPLNLIAEPAAPYSWAAEGGLYLSRTRKTPEQLDRLYKGLARYDDRWQGVVYFKAYPRGDRVLPPFLPAHGDRVLDYGGFAVYGDPELVQEVRSILAEQGFETTAP